MNKSLNQIYLMSRLCITLIYFKAICFIITYSINSSSFSSPTQCITLS